MVPLKKYEIYRAERANGLTAAQIAAKYGVSRQAVCSAVGRYDPFAFTYIEKHQCVYPIWRKWMNSNKVSRAELCRRMGISGASENILRISAYMRGTNYPTKRVIDRLLEATGLTYEELFCEEEPAHGDA
jgi:transcriptional regulator with XRE-family HTH domain